MHRDNQSNTRMTKDEKIKFKRRKKFFKEIYYRIDE